MFLVGSISAQDLLVTTKGDSIHCSLIAVNQEQIFFKRTNPPSQQKDSIARSSVIRIIHDYQKPTSTTNNTPTNNLDKNLKKIDPIRKSFIRFAATGGYSFIVGLLPQDISPSFEKYLRELRTGYNFGGDFTYYFRNRIGLGVTANVFRTQVQMDDVIITDEFGTMYKVDMKDNITIRYFAPHVSFLKELESINSSVYAKAGFGLASYTNEAYLIVPLSIKAPSVGAFYEFGFSTKISQLVSFGIQASYLVSTITEYSVSSPYGTQTVKSTGPDGYDSVNRLNASLNICLDIK